MHTGARAYRASALAGIPFGDFSDDYLFDQHANHAHLTQAQSDGSAHATAAPGQLLSGCALPRVSDGAKVDLGELLSAPVTTLVIFGTYPADFNMIEYAQKVRHYWPQLKAKGVDSGLIVVNGSPDSCKRLAEILDLPADVELLSDEAGEAGRRSR